MSAPVCLRVEPRRRGGFYAFAEGGSAAEQRAAVHRLRDLLRERGVPAESYTVCLEGARPALRRQGMAVVAPQATPHDLPTISRAAAEIAPAAPHSRKRRF